MMIELKDLSFEYKGVLALKNINLTINKGESVAIIGPNGSGKSTLLKLLNGIIFPTTGSYCFDGMEITPGRMRDNKFAKSFHQKMGFIFQNSEAQLFCSSVYEEVAFAPMQMGLAEEIIKMRVEDCLKLLGIERLRDRVPYNLSVGEKKRVAIASVLSFNPEILVLDEPMSGLDPKTKRFLRNFLIELNSAGKTVICATHDFEYIEGIFKRAVVLSQDHTIVKDEPYSKVVSDEEFLYRHNII